MTLYLHSLLSPMPQEKVPINIVSKSATYWLYKLFSGYRAVQRCQISFFV